MATTTIKHVINYLKLSDSNVKYEFDGSIPIRIKNNVKVKGYYNIIMELLKEAKYNESKMDRFQIKQWLEYVQVYVTQINSNKISDVNQILNELNENLSNKTYVLGNKLTIIDIVLYSSLYNIIMNLGNLEKETYINVSRWFDHLQNDNLIRLKNDLIKFNTIHLCQPSYK